MKKIFCAVIVMFVMCTGACAASEDMSAYVRKDVFDAKMETLLTRIEGKIDSLSERIDDVEKRISSANTIADIIHYLPHALLGAIIGAIIIMMYATIFSALRKENQTPEVTVEDVRRIVSEILAENNAKIKA